MCGDIVVSVRGRSRFFIRNFRVNSGLFRVGIFLVFLVEFCFWWYRESERNVRGVLGVRFWGV